MSKFQELQLGIANINKLIDELERRIREENLTAQETVGHCLSLVQSLKLLVEMERTINKEMLKLSRNVA